MNKLLLSIALGYGLQMPDKQTMLVTIISCRFWILPLVFTYPRSHLPIIIIIVSDFLMTVKAKIDAREILFGSVKLGKVSPKFSYISSMRENQPSWNTFTENPFQTYLRYQKLIIILRKKIWMVKLTKYSIPTTFRGP